MANPYQSPKLDRDEQATSSSNPAMPLLCLVGGYHVVTGMLAFLSGLQAGLHIIGIGIAMVLLGSATVWIALRRYSQPLRIATIVWGTILVAVFSFVGWKSIKDARDVAAIYFLLELVVVIPIPFLAYRVRPSEVGK
ncbi:hypothetical protein LOC67_17260 [Stieleria sp. JC731]|uniref:hypothetical protein n=1 Tax=Pirellulaceae TaxID=2691357 RepID=UPI001E5CEDCA|nr:hypothetical protein [Stieleria sp. JC731]MCC9602306.1 hypothetical protein [Stieleria sp. JC731]